MNVSPKVTVGIVTFNRSKCLKMLLAKLMKMKNITELIIVDNNSNDNTVSFLKKVGNFSDINYDQTNTAILENGMILRIYPSTINIGGSGGFRQLVKLFLKFPNEYLWLMDDDVLPEMDCLNRLLSGMDTDTKVCVPNRTDQFFKDKACIYIDLKNPFKFSISRRKKYIENVNDYQYIYIYDFPFEGPLIKGSIISEVGMPDSQYFIICDDTDYAYRLGKHTKMKFIPKATLHRQLANKKGDKTLDWKDYYSLRNDIFFIKKYGQNFWVRNFSPVISWLFWMTVSIVKKRWGNLKIINRAFHDGEKGIRGKTVSPGDM